MSDETNNLDETCRRLTIAELQVKRAQTVMTSVAGFCHALGQPATVIMSSMDLLKMDEVDNETKMQVVDMCIEAVGEIKSLLAEMKQKREYVAEAFRAGDDLAKGTLDLSDWEAKEPPKASWDS